MSKTITRGRGRLALPLLLIMLVALSLSACVAQEPNPAPADVSEPAADTPAPNPPAVTEPTAPAAPESSGPAESASVNGSDTAANMAADEKGTGDVSTWQKVQRTTNGITYSYRYPPGWTADLAYCAPGAARTATGNELPARCASTDILVGEKAQDMGTITGENVSLNGKQAVKQINKTPHIGVASRIYTVMLFDASGVPLVGFSTSIGSGTDEATQNNITAILDQVAGTLTVGR
jgi:hypothetical protein